MLNNLGCSSEEESGLRVAAMLRAKKNEGAGTRTQDQRIKSPLLYQLSYTLSLR